MGYHAAARCDTTSRSSRNRRLRADEGRHRSRIAGPSVAGERRTHQRPTGRRGESPQLCGVAQVASPSANSAGSRRRRQLVERPRDLACAELWQASLERSLTRRGRPTRSSLELFHLQPERDLSRVELLRESAMYSQLRRSAASRRPSMALPSAGGISALALLAATTLP